MLPARALQAHKLVMMQQVASGMRALIESGLVHRDLATRNILLFAYNPRNAVETTVKITDFGLTVQMQNATHLHVDGWVTPSY